MALSQLHLAESTTTSLNRSSQQLQRVGGMAVTSVVEYPANRVGSCAITHVASSMLRIRVKDRQPDSRIIEMREIGFNAWPLMDVAINNRHLGVTTWRINRKRALHVQSVAVQEHKA